MVGPFEKILVAADDVTLLSDIGRSKKIVLNGVGIRSIPDISPFDFSKFKLRNWSEDCGLDEASCDFCYVQKTAGSRQSCIT